MVDYSSLSASKVNQAKKKTTPSVRVPNTMEPLEVDMDQYQVGRQSVKRQSSVNNSQTVIPYSADVFEDQNHQYENSGSEEGDKRSAFRSNPVLPAIPEKGDVSKILRDKSLIRGG